MTSAKSNPSDVTRQSTDPPNPTPPAQAPTTRNPGPSEDPLLQIMKSCSEAAAKHGGPPEKVATTAVLCFLLKTAEALHSAAAADPPANQEPPSAAVSAEK